MTDPKRPASRASAKDFHPEVLRLFDRYVHGGLDRRGFLDGAAKFAVGGTTAAGLLAALTPNFAAAQKIEPGDPRIKGQMVEYPSPKGSGIGRGYLVLPAGAPKTGASTAPTAGRPVVLVIHENRGLNPHIEDIARRLALDDFIAFAPDALAPLGGYPGTEDEARELFGRLDAPMTRQDMLAAAEYAKKIEGGNGKLGAVGFCWGGGVVNVLATQMPGLDAGVPFYGVAPPLDQVANIKASLLLNFAGEDERVNSTWPPYEAALKKAGVSYEAFVYAGVQHGFNNDTTPRFDEAAAKLAWQRTVDFFNKQLRAA